MLANQLLLVSFSLFCIKTINGKPVQKPNETFCYDVQSRLTVLRPYQSKYNTIYRDNPEFKGRKIFNVELVDNIKAPFTKNVWNSIQNLPKIDEEKNDDLSNADTAVINVYNDVAYLLFKRMLEFVDTRVPWEPIGRYLGYEKEIRDLINIALTELMRLQRENVVYVNNLMNVFYYSCDLKYIYEYNNSSNEAYRIKKIFLTRMFQIDEYMESEETRRSEQKIVEDLKSNLHKINNKTELLFGVSISAMKMRILMMERPGNELIRLINNRKVTENESLIHFVNKLALKQNGYKIMIYHLMILGVLTTHAFGYVYNHFLILSELRKHKITPKDFLIVKDCSIFMNGFMSVFLERYFEFKGVVSQDVVDAMYLLLEFLEPFDSETKIDKYLSDEEQNSITLLMHSDKSLATISNYFEDTKSESYGNELIDNAVEVLVGTFNENVTETWNEATKIVYQSLEKNALLDLIKNNYKNIIDILRIFSCEFSNNGALERVII